MPSKAYALIVQLEKQPSASYHTVSALSMYLYEPKYAPFLLLPRPHQL
jgi:hypothetical protein